MEEDKTLYALYVGDCWLSTDSLTCLGVFDEEHLKENCVKAILEYGDFTEEMYENGYDGKSILKFCKGVGYDREKGESKQHLLERYKNDWAEGLATVLIEESQTQGHETNFLISEITLNEYGEI